MMHMEVAQMGLSEDKSNETFSKKNSDTWVQHTDESLQLPLKAVFSITNKKKKKNFKCP